MWKCCLAVCLCRLRWRRARYLSWIDGPLRKNLSAEQRKALVDSRTGRWLRYYGFFCFLMAIIALFVNAFDLGSESLRWRVAWFVIAAFVVLSYLSKRKDPAG